MTQLPSIAPVAEATAGTQAMKAQPDPVASCHPAVTAIAPDAANLASTLALLRQKQSNQPGVGDVGAVRDLKFSALKKELQQELHRYAGKEGHSQIRAIPKRASHLRSALLTLYGTLGFGERLRSPVVKGHLAVLSSAAQTLLGELKSVVLRLRALAERHTGGRHTLNQPVRRLAAELSQRLVKLTSTATDPATDALHAGAWLPLDTLHQAAG